MFALKCVSLLIPLLAGSASALDLDVKSSDSVKFVAKTLASALIDEYKGRSDDIPPGLFSDSGDPYYWSQFGAVWGGLVEYSKLTGDSQFDDVVAEALEFQLGSDRNYMPVNQTRTLDNEGQSNWALAALTASETSFKKPKEGEWLDVAKVVFENLVGRWDEKTCDGGLRWQIFSFNNGYTFKDINSAANFFLLSSRLALATGNETYSNWAEKSFKWAQSSGLISEKFYVFAGLDVENCESINRIQFTAPWGVFTEGAAVMYNLTNGNETWKNTVSKLVEAGDIFKANETSILSEVACESRNVCGNDQKSFKGIASRSLARAALVAPFVAEPLHEILEASAKGAASNCKGEGKDIACGFKWFEANSDVNSLGDEGLSEVQSALEVVQALLYPEAQGVLSNATEKNSTEKQEPSKTGTATGSSETPGAASTTGMAWSAVLFAAVLAASQL
ncbi:glycoside hydrolase family 76 protein [Aaosphaeria arxii CBS 175.79]|uniref:Mannan endo-1,6-alpha-mannosidase n=1 Tax=Aaosphaeria arxii CBS 175.79 TaxID=1450172 RepID=A0A6A5XNM2_9PLEO|nr:glycoside hydrolase family 76 protein [Aaosphaeria arxii CBS 175.79]KAF2013954.1 glycoside hydrolase family 76 protein [Aaosphaeria arxii CBS 175.79]